MVFSTLSVRRKKKFEDDDLLEMIRHNPHLTLRRYAAILGVKKDAVGKRMKKLGFTCKRTRWVPHNLSQQNKLNRVVICQQLLEQHNTNPFLDRLVTQDEKWILYINVQCKREWSLKGHNPSTSAKAGLHPKKVLFCLWRDNFKRNN